MPLIKDDNEECLKPSTPSSTRSEESIQFKFQIPKNKEIADDIKNSNIQQVFQQKFDTNCTVQNTDEKKNVNIFILPDRDFQMTLRFLKENDDNDKCEKCPVCNSTINRNQRNKLKIDSNEILYFDNNNINNNNKSFKSQISLDNTHQLEKNVNQFFN